MKNYKTLPTKKLPKNDREQAVLLGLIELYLKTGKPVGSHTLQESGFESLSSATIRNYFAKMEQKGLLMQQHTSGGRIPTDKALRIYVETLEGQGVTEKEQEERLQEALEKPGKEIATTLHQVLETLSELSNTAVFLSSPRFDQDFIQQIRLISLDPLKLLAIVITDFGLTHTETIYLQKPADPLFLRTAEEYFAWRLNKGEKPLFTSEAEAKLAQRIYNEVLVRHVVGHANFLNEDILRGGLSRLLNYIEFSDASQLAKGLAILEAPERMRHILRECCKKNALSCWIGEEMESLGTSNGECTLLAIPYRINQTIAGAVAILGPRRLPYRSLFGLLQLFSELLSRSLTDSLYKYKISFRPPENQPTYPQIEEL